MTQAESNEIKSRALREAIARLDAELRAMPAPARNDALNRVALISTGQDHLDRTRRERGA